MPDSIIDVNDTKQMELYIHVPFCTRKCFYCDFLSFPVHETEHQAYVDQLVKELALGSAMAAGHEISSIFIGGGTPSLLDPKHIVRILDTVRAHYVVRKDAEITIEVNPASTIQYKLKAYRAAGINRLSIGLQSANDAELKTLGRIHIFDDFLKCFQSARMEGFQNINIDLMNDIPGQTVRSWKDTLRHVLMLKPEHLSIYNLIIEDGTPFKKMLSDGALSLPNEGVQMMIDFETKSAMEKYGYHRYEVSNYAKPGFECRHNYGYWSNVPYLGFGLGASSYLEHTLWSVIRDYQAFLDLDLEADARNGYPQLFTDVEKLTRNDEMAEFMFLGLRRTAGISEIEFTSRFQVDIHSVYGPVLDRYTAEGLLIHEGYRYRFSDHGFDVSNQVLSDFLLD